jgi:hypothetical protein
LGVGPGETSLDLEEALMPRVRDLLYRFRPAGAPGAATAAGVPVDRSADLAAELEQLFAQLADVERECAAIRDDAERDAAAIRERGIERAHGVVSGIRTRSQAERAAAAARMHEQTAAEGTARLAEARRAADAVRDRAAPLLPHYADEVVESVLAMLRDESAVPARQPASP